MNKHELYVIRGKLVHSISFSSPLWWACIKGAKNILEDGEMRTTQSSWIPVPTYDM